MECIICHKTITGQYYQDFWGNAVCVKHYEKGETTTCSSCTALMPKSGTHLPDGRYLCASCTAQVVSTSEQIAKIKKIVLSKLIDEGVSYQDRRLESVPIDLVNIKEMSRLKHEKPNIMNKGLTVTRSEVTLGGMLFGKKPKMQHHIFMLDNQIKIEFAGTLGHELMHVWQNENGLILPPPQCEGLCNLGSWLVYNTISSAKSPYFKKAMQENPDPVYGDGFRAVYAKYQQTGWEGVLNLALKGKL